MIDSKDRISATLGTNHVTSLIGDPEPKRLGILKINVTDKADTNEISKIESSAIVDYLVLPKGTTTMINAEIVDHEGNLLPIGTNETPHRYVLTIEGAGGSASRTVGFEFIDGTVSKELTWNDCGRWVVNESIINRDIINPYEQLVFDRELIIEFYE